MADDWRKELNFLETSWDDIRTLAIQFTKRNKFYSHIKLFSGIWSVMCRWGIRSAISVCSFLYNERAEVTLMIWWSCYHLIKRRENDQLKQGYEDDHENSELELWYADWSSHWRATLADDYRLSPSWEHRSVPNEKYVSETRWQKNLWIY